MVCDLLFFGQRHEEFTTWVYVGWPLSCVPISLNQWLQWSDSSSSVWWITQESWPEVSLSLHRECWWVALRDVRWCERMGKKIRRTKKELFEASPPANTSFKLSQGSFILNGILMKRPVVGILKNKVRPRFPIKGTFITSATALREGMIKNIKKKRSTALISFGCFWSSSWKRFARWK